MENIGMKQPRVFVMCGLFDFSFLDKYSQKLNIIQFILFKKIFGKINLERTDKNGKDN